MIPGSLCMIEVQDIVPGDYMFDLWSFSKVIEIVWIEYPNRKMKLENGQDVVVFADSLVLVYTDRYGETLRIDTGDVLDRLGVRHPIQLL